MEPYGPGTGLVPRAIDQASETPLSQLFDAQASQQQQATPKPPGLLSRIGSGISGALGYQKSKLDEATHRYLEYSTGAPKGSFDGKTTGQLLGESILPPENDNGSVMRSVARGLISTGEDIATDPLSIELGGLGEVAGAGRAAEGFVGPRTLDAASRAQRAITAGKVARPLSTAATVGFTGQQLGEGLPQLYRGITDPNMSSQERGQTLAQGGVSTLFGGLGAAHLAGEFGRTTPPIRNMTSVGMGDPGDTHYVGPTQPLQGPLPPEGFQPPDIFGPHPGGFSEEFPQTTPRSLALPLEHPSFTSYQGPPNPYPQMEQNPLNLENNPINLQNPQDIKPPEVTPPTPPVSSGFAPQNEQDFASALENSIVPGTPRLAEGSSPGYRVGAQPVPGPYSRPGNIEQQFAKQQVSEPPGVGQTEHDYNEVRKHVEGGTDPWNQTTQDLGVRGEERRQNVQPVDQDQRVGERRASLMASDPTLRPEHANMIAQAQIGQEDALRASKTDPLTGLKNRAGWNDVLASQQDGDQVFALDMKSFKSINDAFGHHTGDQVLIAVSDVLRNHFGDDAARLGGDEFGALMRGIPPEDAQTKALAVQDEIRHLQLQISDGKGATIDGPRLDAHIGVGANGSLADSAANESALTSRLAGRAGEQTAQLRATLPSEGGGTGTAQPPIEGLQGGGGQEPAETAQPVVGHDQTAQDQERIGRADETAAPTEGTGTGQNQAVANRFEQVRKFNPDLPGVLPEQEDAYYEKRKHVEGGENPFDILREQVSPLPKNGPSKRFNFADGARERLRSRAAGSSPASTVVPGGDQFADMVIVGAEHIANGASRFADWAKLMVKEFGSGIQTHLTDLWNLAQRHIFESENSVTPPKGPTPNLDLRDAARQFAKERGFDTAVDKLPYATVDETKAKQVADDFKAMPHDPSNPKVASSYEAMKRDIIDQWNYLKSKGYNLEPWNKEGQPYANSQEMRDDLKNNKHLYFFQGGDMPEDHPLAADSGDGLTYNDKFRAVHDAFTHAKEGFEFGPRGEENAYREHLQMFSPEARGAMATETRGQNSWVNYGAHLRDANGNVPKMGQPGYIPPPERPYAAQKAGLLPEASQYDQLENEPENVRKITPTPTGEGGQVLVPDVARALEARTQHKWGAVDLKDMPEVEKRAKQQLSNEIKYQLGQPDTGVGWYKADVDKAKDMLQQWDPELKDPVKMDLFTHITAPASNGVDPNGNIKTAMKVWEAYKETGKIPLDQGNGKNWQGRPAIKIAMARLQRLIDDKGEQGAVDWLNSKHPVSELRQYNPDVSGKASDQKYGSYVNGPKIGPFAQNLKGVQDEFTSDRWFNRSWNRWMGTMFQPPKMTGDDSFNFGENAPQALQDDPRGEGERALQKKVVTEVGKDFGLTTSETQAVQWRFEQQLYKQLGADIDDNQSYASAVKNALDERGIRIPATGDSGQAGEGRENAQTGGLPEELPESGKEASQSIEDQHQNKRKYITSDPEDIINSMMERARRMNVTAGNLNLSEIPGAFKDVVHLGAAYLERGVYNFADWSKAMTSHLGGKFDDLKDRLEEIWDLSKDLVPNAEGAPRVEGKVSKYEDSARRLGIEPFLDRDTPRPWSELPTAKIEDRYTDNDFLSKINNGRPLTDAEHQVWDARTRQKYFLAQNAKMIADKLPGDEDAQKDFNDKHQDYMRAIQADINAGTEAGRALAARGRTNPAFYATDSPDNIIDSLKRRLGNVPISLESQFQKINAPGVWSDIAHLGSSLLERGGCA